MKVIAYCKASDTIGLGHLARVSSLLLLFDEFDSIIYVEGTLPPKWQAQHHPLSFIAGDDVNETYFLQRIVEANPHLAVVDAYGISPDFIESIQRRHCPVLHFNDFIQGELSAAFTLCTGLPDISNFFIPSYGTVYLGHEYTPLRPPFFTSQHSKYPNFNVVVNMGGADTYHLVSKILAWLDENVSAWNVAAISGKPQKMRNNQLTLLTSVSADELAAVYRSSNIGILPVSVSAVEAIACDLPIYLIQTASNQALLKNSLIRESGVFFWFDMTLQNTAIPFEVLLPKLNSVQSPISNKFRSKIPQVLSEVRSFLNALSHPYECIDLNASAFKKTYIKSS